jgi:Uma2 family endonuclease
MALVQQAARRVSFADLKSWPDDGRRYELYEGEVSVVPAPMPVHQQVVLRLAILLNAYAEDHGGEAFVSPIDIVFTPFDVVQPDVAYFGQPARTAIDVWSPIRAVPDLVVEVMSPGSVAGDRGRKMRAFERFGVPEYWVVDPVAETVEVHRREAGSYVLWQHAGAADVVRSPNLPDLEFLAADVFPV